jgi:tRNA A-37 threonylcarbamoyl transferase component Bud32
MLPRLVLRDEVAGLLDLPWERPLSAWDGSGHRFRELPVGPSRHLVRFLVAGGIVYALKELPEDVAGGEYRVLRHLEQAGLPAVRAVALAVRPDRDDAILMTEYLRHSMQYRRLLMRLRSSSPAYRDRLLDAMALLLVDLHRAGVFWGDCSLANTLFRRDGDRIQAYLVDAETSEIHQSLSDGQRRYDLDILVENVAFGLADLAAYVGQADDMDGAIEAAESVRMRYEAVWTELFGQPDLIPGDRLEIRARLRRLNDLGFSVDLEVDPVAPPGTVVLRTLVTTRRYHANELERRTRLRALEGQAKLLLDDLTEYGAWLECTELRSISPEEAAERWLREVYRPTQARIAREVGPERDLVQAYCDVLEHKWLLSERAGHDVGLEAAIESYVAQGAPAPERPDRVESPDDPLAALDVETEAMEADDSRPSGPSG